MSERSLLTVKTFFEYPSVTAFSKDWKQLSDEDQQQIRRGIGDGTLNY